MTEPRVTICVLLYGDHAALARRCLESIQAYCPRAEYRLIVGSNTAGPETLDYLSALQSADVIDRRIDSPVNLNKCPMMRRMLEAVDTEFIWWFDDDSFITEPGTFTRWMRAADSASEDVAMWGQLAVCDTPDAFAPDLEDVRAFVRGAAWYRGLPPPSWRPGGKGEFDLEGHGTGDGQWMFAVGGCWMIRTAAIRALDWPDRRIVKMGDDVFLGEALRQHGWSVMNLGSRGVNINSALRRGDPGRQPGRVCVL